MHSLPALTAHHALFLDFDGTLVEIAAQPHCVQVSASLLPILEALQQHLGGALALVTGREQADVDAFLAPLTLPMASEHGAKMRWGNDSTNGGKHDGPNGGMPVAKIPDLAAVTAAAQALAAQHPELLLEFKRASVALHYRQAPHLEPLCRATLEHAVRETSGVELLHGKCVLEVKSADVHKGHAIAAFMQTPPFAQRTPVFVGDDVTDEAGFAAVVALGGVGIKVGPGASQAQYRCSSPAAVRAWLLASCAALAP